jgi:hypothetical protein
MKNIGINVENPSKKIYGDTSGNLLDSFVVSAESQP